MSWGWAVRRCRARCRAANRSAPRLVSGSSPRAHSGSRTASRTRPRPPSTCPPIPTSCPPATPGSNRSKSTSQFLFTISFCFSLIKSLGRFFSPPRNLLDSAIQVSMNRGRRWRHLRQQRHLCPVGHLVIRGRGPFTNLETPKKRLSLTHPHCTFTFLVTFVFPLTAHAHSFTKGQSVSAIKRFHANESASQPLVQLDFFIIIRERLYTLCFNEFLQTIETLPRGRHCRSENNCFCFCLNDFVIDKFCIVFCTRIKMFCETRTTRSFEFNVQL